MKTKINSILVVYMLFSFMLGNSTAFAQAKSNEIFDSFFLLKFGSDDNFQKSRVVFPITHIGIDDEYFKPDTSYIEKEDWKHIKIFSEEMVALNVRTQVYDNFDLIIG